MLTYVRQNIGQWKDQQNQSTGRTVVYKYNSLILLRTYNKKLIAVNEDTVPK